ncbi:hypothetical protein CRUP_022874 [Coryphaenoides rupestris]|nr:hypothetical protein CRUP_022874 [Coryphaenoides rupestris]
MAELHPLWKEAAKLPQKYSRLDRYKEIIRSLPRVNRTTLAALVGHLYRVQRCADLNHMCTKNLSLLFAPSLFQTDGKGEHEVKIMEDLIDSYLYVFDLSQAGDLIIEVYLEMKIPDCCITLKPMKVQQDSVEERLESPSPLALPDLPEPLYEEVGDFGLQVLHSLETSFLSGRVSDTHEGPDLPHLLDYTKTP